MVVILSSASHGKCFHNHQNHISGAGLLLSAHKEIKGLNLGQPVGSDGIPPNVVGGVYSRSKNDNVIAPNQPSAVQANPISNGSGLVRKLQNLQLHGGSIRKGKSKNNIKLVF